MDLNIYIYILALDGRLNLATFDLYADSYIPLWRPLVLAMAGHDCGKVSVEPEVQHLPADLDITCNSDDMPLYLDDDDDEDAVAAGAAHMGGSLATGRMSLSSALPLDCDDEPAYLDDSEDEASEMGMDSSLAQISKSWSIFSKSGFFTAQRLQEHLEDPTIVARLHRARLQKQRQRREDQIRIQRVLSVITPLRSATIAASVRCGEAGYETAGVE